MDHIEKCILELRQLKNILKNKDLEICKLNSARKDSSSLAEQVKDLNEKLRALKSENKGLKESLKIISDLRKKDKLVIERWKQHMSSQSASQSGAPVGGAATTRQPAQELDIPTDETRLESSPPTEEKQRRFSSSLPVIDEADSLGDEPLFTRIKTESFDAVDGTTMGPPPIFEANDLVAASASAAGAGVEVHIDELLRRNWHPNDFAINPDYNEGHNHAYHEKILGKHARENLNCTDCPSCNKFNRLSGTKVQAASRHREKWAKQDTPPGFWRSGFDSVAESQDRKEAARKTRAEAIDRLHEAIHSGRFLFKNAELQELAKNGLIKS